jgi:integrase
MARTIPISARLRSFLDTRRTDPKGVPFSPGALVFGNEVGGRVKSVKKAWARTGERAGIEGLHLHDLGREFASQLQESPGVSPHEVATWLGHSNITTTSRYLSTTTAGHLQHILKKLEQARQIRTTFAQRDQEADQAAAEESTDILDSQSVMGR